MPTLEKWRWVYGQNAGRVHFKTQKQERADKVVRSHSVYRRNLDLHWVTPALWELIKKHNFPPRLFKFGQQPCRIERDEDDGPYRIRILNPDRGRQETVKLSKWVKYRGKTPSLCPPPAPVIHDLLATENPPLPPITRITRVPVFAAHGRLVQAPGYDSKARLFYDPSKNLEIRRVSADPVAEVIAAKEVILDELLGDFSFASEADKAHAVALLLQPFVRDVTNGPTPLFAVDASSPRAGKELLAQCATFIAHEDDRSLLPPADNEEEIRKRILALLQEGTPVVQIDNQRRKLNSGVLAAALTAHPTWKDRKLGVTENIGVPVRNTWILTGNNLQLSDELNRRAVRIRLVPEQERPWERGQGTFRHPNLLAWVRENRGRLVWAALTIISSWVYAGQQRSAKTLGSFEEWSAIIGGILEHARIPGFLENREAQNEALDADTERWSRFVHKWNERFGKSEVTSSQLLSEVIGINSAYEEPLLILWGTDYTTRIASLGRQLGAKRDAIFSGHQIIKVPGSGHQSAKWKLVPVR